MALLFVDGFDHYAADDILKKWSSIFTGLPSMVTGRFGGQGIHMDAGVDDQLQKSINPSAEDVFLGVAFRFTDVVGSTVTSVVRFKDSAGSVIATVALNDAEKLALYRGADSQTLLVTGTTTIVQNDWNYLEIHYVPLNSGGTFEIKLNGVVEATFSGDTTLGLEDVRAFQLYETGGHDIEYDDLYILDSTGSTNNTYLGDSRVVAEVPTTDTTEASFTPSSGTDHFAMVDDLTDIDDDTTYVENATLGATDRYTSAAIGVTGNVYGVQISTTARKTDTKDRGFKASIKSGATEKEDTSEHTLTASYIVYTDVYDVDPNTSSAWTVANADSLAFGFKITTAE